MSVTRASENAPVEPPASLRGMFLNDSDGGPPGHRTRKKLTILVVDDEPKILDLVTTILRDEGYKVLCANSSIEAVTRHQDAECVDLLFTDIVMPGGCNGLELAHQLLEQCPKMKVLVSTGYSDQPNSMTAVGVGFPVLVKPYTARDLIGAIGDMLKDD